MGRALVLLTNPGPEELSEVVKEHKEWWESWFEKLVPWSPSISVSTREVWIRCLGVSLQVWGLTFFTELASQLGTFIELDEETRVKARYDMARVKISISSGLEVVSHKEVWVDGTSFVIKLVEKKTKLLEFKVQNGDRRCGCRSDAFSSVGSKDRVPAVATWEVFSDGDCSEHGMDTGQCANGQALCAARVDLG
ncbi:hypothetical protein A2U01_0013939, partial [Trifolium medium]|nr:hypothetical protein [Trifolium medium]